MAGLFNAHVFTPPATYGHHRVLIVDDYPDTAISTGLLVKAIGCQSAYALDAQEALRTGELFKPTLILLDLSMPDVDGLETCRRIRELHWGRRVRIIAYTGWGPNEVHQRAMEAGFDGYLLKPLDRHALIKVLDECDAASGDGQLSAP